jgi:hypothetical protein
VVGLGSLVVTGFEAAPADLTAAASPRSVLTQDRTAFRSSALAVGLLSGLAGGLGGGLVSGFGFSPTLGLLGFLSGLPFGLAGGLHGAAWGPFAVARGLLAGRGRLPWQLMAFLADAHEQRGVLRRVGAVYQFRHVELQRRLANR